MHFSVAGIVLTAGCQVYGRCRRKYWTMAPIPNTMAGNRIPTTIGGRAAAVVDRNRGARKKKTAARPAIATHSVATHEKHCHLGFGREHPCSGQRLPAARPI